MSVHKSLFILLYLSIMITSSTSTSNTTVPNLIFSINTQLSPLSISSYLQSFLSSSSNIAHFTIANSTDISFTNPSSLGINETLQLSLDETYSNQIHSYQTISRSSHITAKETITTDISANIIPPMYYKGKSPPSFEDSNIDCTYIHSYIINKDNYLHLNIRSIIPFENLFNVGLNENDEIVLFTINDNTQTTNVITLNMIGIEEKYSVMKYTELYYKPNPRMHPVYTDGMYICGISYDETDLQNDSAELVNKCKVVVIHIEQVNNVTITKVIDMDIHPANVNSITLDSNYVYIATNNNGILIYSIQTSSNDIMTVSGIPPIDTSNSNILDIMPLPHGIYVTVQNKGLYYIEHSALLFPPFQWTSQPLLTHPHLERIDYMYSDYYNIHSTLYVGIIVRNTHSDDVNEIVIENITNSSCTFSKWFFVC